MLKTRVTLSLPLLAMALTAPTCVACAKDSDNGNPVEESCFTDAVCIADSDCPGGTRCGAQNKCTKILCVKPGGACGSSSNDELCVSGAVCVWAASGRWECWLETTPLPRGYGCGYGIPCEAGLTCASGSTSASLCE